MAEDKDIRWKQRFANYKKALIQLTRFIDKGQLNDLEQQGFIKAFEYTFELSWKVIKDFYEEQGEASIQGSKDSFRLAFRRGLILEGQIWMDMIDSRIKTVHTYNEDVAIEIANDISKRYFSQFLFLREQLDKIVNE